MSQLIATPMSFGEITGVDVRLYTGDGLDNRNIDKFRLQPDLLFVKKRSAVGPWNVVDSVRGPTINLNCNVATAEATDADNIQAFNSDGFQVGTDTEVNLNTATFLSFGFKRGVAEGLDIVTYTGDFIGGRTVAHNLGVVPTFMIVKNRDGTRSWGVFHKDLAPSGDPAAEAHLKLESNAAEAISTDVWEDTNPDATNFTVGQSNTTNELNKLYIGYVFTDKAGKFATGEYNGSGAEKAITGLGFSPRLVWIKRRTGSSNKHWRCFFLNESGAMRRLEQSRDTAEASPTQELKTFDSDGFTLGTDDSVNVATGGRYVWCAWRM